MLLQKVDIPFLQWSTVFNGRCIFWAHRNIAIKLILFMIWLSCWILIVLCFKTKVLSINSRNNTLHSFFTFCYLYKEWYFFLKIGAMINKKFEIKTKEEIKFSHFVCLTNRICNVIHRLIVLLCANWRGGTTKKYIP